MIYLTAPLIRDINKQVVYNILIANNHHKWLIERHYSRYLQANSLQQPAVTNDSSNCAIRNVNNPYATTIQIWDQALVCDAHTVVLF